MPTYCYRDTDGRLVEKVMTCDEHAKKDKGGILIEGGQTFMRDYAAEHCGQKAGHSGWPMESEAAAVDPSYIPKVREFDRKSGVPTDYTKAGCPIFRDMSHQRNYLRAHKMHMRNSYL